MPTSFPTAHYLLASELAGPTQFKQAFSAFMDHARDTGDGSPIENLANGLARAVTELVFTSTFLLRTCERDSGVNARRILDAVCE
jgi:hypothetical protein